MHYDVTNLELLKRLLQEIPDDDSCMEWPRARHRQGYGRFEYQGRMILAHRLSYELTHGPLEASADVLHSCDNPPCFRPSHLTVGKHDDNMKDCAAKGRNVNPSSKLNREKAEEIRRRVASGESQTSLAREFGVSKPNISNIIRLIVYHD